MKETADKNKAHIVYRLSDGTRVPGVTTITSELGWSKETLCRWHNRMGLNGIDTSKYVDEKANIGTLAHAFCTNDLLGKTTDTYEYSQLQIDQAENSYLKFLAWKKSKSIDVVLVEKPLVSELHRYGGTLDILAEVDGILELIDLKTGSGIYPEHFVQVGGGYWQLAFENGYSPQRARILNIPRTKDEKFDEEFIPNIDACILIFFNCLETYYAKKYLKGGDNV